MQSRKILIIDDDPSVTKLLQTKLQARPGITVTTTNTAKDAVELAASFQPDLIVCDIDLGGSADGGVVAHHLGSEPSTAAIPILFLSSMITPGDTLRQSGGRRLISKKIPITEIIDLILKEAT